MIASPAPHDDPDVQACLAGHSVEDAVLILDALDLLYLAGASGLTDAVWLRRLMHLHGPLPYQLCARLREVCASVVVVYLSDDRQVERTAWMARQARPVALDAEPELAECVRLTSLCLDLMRRNARFTPTGLSRAMMQHGGLDRSTATELVQHMIAQFPATLRHHPDGALSFEDAPAPSIQESVRAFGLLTLHPDLRLIDKDLMQDFLRARRTPRRG